MIANEILMYLRNLKKNAGTISLQDIVGIDHDGNEVRVEDKLADDKNEIDIQVSERIQLKKLHDIMCKVLHGREKLVILMRYGLGPTMEEMTQREIAGALEISRSYVSRIEKKALTKLRKEMSEASRA
ncbi:MAG: sigma-70 family RNA polymerase sigma factor [Defluviitaleaceae bacterium]|nr:sigma-70 family RNA polymerase sigma factor [Defluviitaleaceae bacterium]